MAQMPNREATPTAPTGVITVADLLSRYAPARPVDPEPPTVPVSVASLLLREGRSPQPESPPAPPSAPVRDDYVDEPAAEAPGGTAVLVRRGALATGALLLVGAAFGAAVVHDTSTVGQEVRALTDYPGQGRLDSRPAPTAGAPTVVGQAAQSDVLDAGADAPTSWMGSAFPDAPSTDAATTDSAATDSAATDTPATDTGSTSAGGSATPDTGGGPVTGESDRTAPAETDQDGGDSGAHDSGSDDQDSGGLGGTVEDLGGAVDGAGDILSEHADDGMVGSVAGLAGSLL